MANSLVIADNERRSLKAEEEKAKTLKQFVAPSRRTASSISWLKVKSFAYHVRPKKSLT